MWELRKISLAHFLLRMSGEVQEYVLSILRVYCEHGGSQMESEYVACWARRNLGEEGRRKGKENMVQIIHPKKGVNLLFVLVMSIRHKLAKG